MRFSDQMEGGEWAAQEQGRWRRPGTWWRTDLVGGDFSGHWVPRFAGRVGSAKPKAACSHSFSNRAMPDSYRWLPPGPCVLVACASRQIRQRGSAGTAQAAEGILAEGYQW